MRVRLRFREWDSAILGKLDAGPLDSNSDETVWSFKLVWLIWRTLPGVVGVVGVICKGEEGPGPISNGNFFSTPVELALEL